MKKYTDSQKRQLKELRRQVAEEKKYTPRGQGDGINQHLKFRSLYSEIRKVQADPKYRSRRVPSWI